MSEKPLALAEKNDRLPMWDPPTAEQHVARRAAHDRRYEHARDPSSAELNEHLRDERTGCEVVVDALVGRNPSR